MKHLPKHLRPRWRYLAVAVETWPGAGLQRDAFQRAAWDAARSLLGDPGSAALDLSVVGFQAADASAGVIVRTRRGEVERARAVLACLDEVAGDPCGIRVLGISGTVRACEEKYMGARPEHAQERDVAFEGVDRPAFVRADRVDVRVDGAFVGATTLETG